MDGQLNEQDAVGFKAKLKLHQDSGSDVTLPPSARHASSNTTTTKLLTALKTKASYSREHKCPHTGGSKSQSYNSTIKLTLYKQNNANTDNTQV